MCARVHVDPVLQRRDAHRYLVGAEAHQVLAAGNHRRLAQPQQMRLYLIRDDGRGVGSGEHVAAAYIYFTVEHQRD